MSDVLPVTKPLMEVVPAPLFLRVMVIINPAAGVDRPILRLLNTAMAEAGLAWEVAITHQAGDARRLAQEAVAAGFDLVAAHGGDGTVMEVACGLQGTGVPMAILPGGTANMMAVELGIPYDLDEAVGLIAKRAGALRPVDMGIADELMFLLRVGIGLEADMMKSADPEMKNRLGVLAYAVSGFNELLNATPTRYRLTLDRTQVFEVEGFNCMIANSGVVSVNGLRLSRKIDVSDGWLDVIILRNTDIGALLSVTARVLSQGEATDLPDLLHWQAKEVTLEADPPQTVSVDGEIIPPGPVTARILPHAVTMLVPMPTG